MVHRTRGTVSRFASFISIVVTIFALAIFLVWLPGMLNSIEGRIFAGLWLVMSIAVIWIHVLHLLEERRSQRLSKLFERSRQLNKSYQEKGRGHYLNRTST